MNPKFTDLKGATITVTNADGEYQFVCSEVTQGAGRNKYDLTIVGMGISSPEVHEQYDFAFGSESWGGRFERIWKGNGVFKVEYSTLVSSPEFWP